MLPLPCRFDLEMRSTQSNAAVDTDAAAAATDAVLMTSFDLPTVTACWLACCGYAAPAATAAAAAGKKPCSSHIDMHGSHVR